MDRRRPSLGGILRVLPVILAVALCWTLTGGAAGGCAGQAPPQLVRVTDIAPRAVEVGDQLAIAGEGFPAGREARVTFRGTLRRPGERPERSAEVVLAGTVTAPDQVEVPFTEAAQALFCRAGDRAAHTTFEGEVEVAFAALAAGAPPVAGSIARVTLDVRPSAAPSDEGRERAGKAFLAWAGIDATDGPSGLVVISVRPGSRAEAAHIAPGDVIASFDGVRVASAADAIPGPGAHEVPVGMLGSDATRTLVVGGFRRAPPEELLAASLIALGALAVALLLGAPASRAVASRLQRVVARLRTGSVPTLRAAALDALPPAGLPALVDAMAYAMLAALPFGQYLVAAQLDVGILFVAAATSLVVAAIFTRPSIGAGVGAAAHVAAQHVPAAAGVVAVVATVGSLRIQEIVRAQGGWPWDWLAFRSPAAPVALALLVACARIEPDAPSTPPGVAAFVDDLAPGADRRRDLAPRPRRSAWLDVACRAHRLIIAGLASVLLLGGWLLPGLTAAEQAGRPLLQIAGAAWLLGKTFGFVTFVAWSRRALPSLRLRERTRIAAVAWGPAAGGAVLLAVAWAWWSPPLAAQRLVSGGLISIVLLAGAAVAHRVRHGVMSPAGDGRVSPFL